MRKFLWLSIVVGLLVSLAPHAVAEQMTCLHTIQEGAALREASQRLARANLHPSRFLLDLDLSGHAYLTRAQVAVMVVQMLGWGDQVANVNDTSVNGEPGGTFAPNRKATMTEAELVLGRALRVAPNLTLDNVSQALSQAGISTRTSCSYVDGKVIDAWQYLLILDRAMSAPLYSRFSASPDGTAP